MAIYQLVMPKMGESIAEATIIRWLKNEGDKVNVDESVLEIATDKVDSEVPTPSGGTLVKKLFQENEVVAVGTVIAEIETEASGLVNLPITTNVSPMPSSVPSETPVDKVEETIQAAMHETRPNILSAPASGRFYSPLVLNIARNENVSMSELELIPGTGAENRVTKRDILAYIENGRGAQIHETISSKSSAPMPEVMVSETPSVQINTPKAEPQILVAVPPAAPSPQAKPNAPAINLQAGDEIIEMDRMRRLIADHMVMSKSVSPHVTSFVEADVTNLVLWRDRNKVAFEKREGEKITYTPAFIEVVTKAIKDYPLINVSVDGYNIVKKKNINIGMAAALPSGNLIVPVIKNADMLNLVGLTKMVNDLASRAKANKLAPDEIQGGTFTLTNVGSFGNVMGTPIINQPQVAILATGSIKKKPAVIETEYGDTIAIRHMMFLSLSYDHRVVDGSLGGSFLRRVADYLEQWDVHREI